MCASLFLCPLKRVVRVTSPASLSFAPAGPTPLTGPTQCPPLTAMRPAPSRLRPPACQCPARFLGSSAECAFPSPPFRFCPLFSAFPGDSAPCHGSAANQRVACACHFAGLARTAAAVANPGRTDHGRRFPVSVDTCPVDLYPPRSPGAGLPVTRAGPSLGGPQLRKERDTFFLAEGGEERPFFPDPK